MTEDAELLMTLYDAKEYKAITENYVVHWSRDGLMSDLDQMYNLRVMFTVSQVLVLFEMCCKNYLNIFDRLKFSLRFYCNHYFVGFR